MPFQDPTHRRKASRAFAWAMLGLAVTAATAKLTPPLFVSAVPTALDVGSRLAFALRWLLVPGLTLLAGVVGAARRGFYADAIDGTRTPASRGLEINLRYNQNTIEQILLAVFAWVGLALELAPDGLPIIPVMAILFAIGRATFWVGYLITPIGRAFGMVMTAAPTLAAYAWLADRALHHLLR
jgi:hypothetical protein